MSMTRRMGLTPKSLQSDNGAQFTGELIVYVAVVSLYFFNQVVYRLLFNITFMACNIYQTSHILFRSIMKELGVQIYRASPRSPETGGRFERVNGTLKKMLELLLLDSADRPTLTLDEALEEVLYLYK